MERRLILLRHAKSSWDSDARTDHERPLNGRGKHDAPRVGEVLAERGWVPEYVASSDAKRTTQTWKRMREAFDGDAEVVFSRDLYGGGLDEIQDAAHEWPDRLDTVMVIGHNPGWEHAASVLSGITLGMTTCNAVLLRGDGDSWAEALVQRWELVDVIRPRELE